MSTEQQFTARWHELLEKQIDQSDESISIAFAQAYSDVFGKPAKAERWVGEPVTA